MNKRATPAVALAAATLLAGCGGGGDKTAAVLTSNDPANKSFEGSFSALATAPKDSPAVIGLADMVVGHGKTRVTITASGLDNKAQYVGWLQADSCKAADPGGGHFKFIAASTDQPPNSIRLDIQFEVDRHGSKLAGITADVTTDGDASAAKSVIIYLKRTADASADLPSLPKLACAELTPQ